ncbi:MAG: phenylalanine--tRNA ligase subunit beta, partial [Myxococcota bacterium]
FPAELDALRLPADDSLRRAARLANPIQGEGSLLSTTLVPGLLRAVRRNLARQVESVRIFEVGRVFLARGPGELPDEPLRASAVLTRGERASLWEPATAPAPFFAAKGIAESLLDGLGRRAAFHAGSDASWLHPGASGELRRGNTVLCRLGEIHPEVAAAFEIAVPCALLELDLSAVLAMAAELAPVREVSPYPAVRRDLAVLLAADQPAGDVLDAIRKIAGNVLVSAAIFDRYEGKGIPAGKVSVAFRLVFQRPDRTLLDSEVTKTTERVIDMLGQRFGGVLR